jgi:hypothetical protein
LTKTTCGIKEQENATTADLVYALECHLLPLLAQGKTTADDSFLISQYKLLI